METFAFSGHVVYDGEKGKKARKEGVKNELHEKRKGEGRMDDRTEGEMWKTRQNIRR